MTTELTDAERLIKLETELVAIRDVVIRMETKLDAWQANYVPRDELKEMFKSRDDKIGNLQKQIDDLHEEKKSNKQLIPNWALALIALASLIGTVGPHIWR